MGELVVLVDEKNNVLGTSPKESVHTQNTPLHRGFSLFLFNSKEELLITRRAFDKKTFPGVWTNTVCGHPGPEENVIDAAKRRLLDELGIAGQDVKDIREVAPYRYRFADKNGIVENEICPVIVARSEAEPKPNREEVAEWKLIGWKEFLKDLEDNPEVYSPWSREESSFITPQV